MGKQFHLVKNGQNVGPFSAAEVLQKIQAGEVQWTDYLYDEQSQDWVMAIERTEFAEKFNAGFGTTPSQPAEEKGPFDSGRKYRDKEWFLLRGANNYGPYSYLEVIQMLQEKALYEYDYIWHQDLPAWKRIAEIPDFAPDTVKDLKNSVDQEVAEIFFRRRHARAQYGCSLIVHDNKSVYKGHSVEISAGGAGIIIQAQVLQPGQTVFLHFQPGDGVPPFNALCHVVSRQFVKVSAGLPQPLGDIKYGVKFTSISQNIRESIKNFAEAKPPKSA